MTARHEVSWPAVGSRALLTPTGGAPRSTRVQDVDGSAVAVLPPLPERGVFEPPLEGAAFELSWPGPRGLVVVPVVMRARVVDQVQLWWLDAAGPAAVDQRRSYVRADVEAPFPVRVVLDWELPERGRAAGELQDLSEGGLRAHLRGEAADRCPESASVGVRLTLVDVGDGAGVDVTEHELFGTVLRAGALPEAAEAGDVVEVVVQLHDGPAGPTQGDVLRRLVFAWQRRARQR